MAESLDWPWVSRSSSWRTRSVSGSWSRGRISTSQSIAHLLGLGEQFGRGGVGVLFDGVAELRQPEFKEGQRFEKGVAVVREDGGPQRRVAGRDAGRVAKAGRRQV